MPSCSKRQMSVQRVADARVNFARSDFAPGGGDQVSKSPLSTVKNRSRRMHILIVTNYFAPERARRRYVSRV